jgi:MFS family permease
MKKSIKRGLMYGITANVILLSLTSLLTDVSSEMIQPLIPLFIASLGASAFIVGILGGLSDSFAAIFHMFSGYWSDLTGKRKRFVISGYSGSAVAKLIMSFAKSWPVVFIMRPIERIGKGLR